VTVDLDQRLELADQVLAAVGELPQQTVAVLSRALMLDGGVLRGFGVALSISGGSDELARLQIARVIRVLGRHDELVERLGQAREQPWVALHAAIRAAR
jgi:hypothetical protein